jgi:hypothetical protein
MLDPDHLDIADFSALGTRPCLVVEAAHFRRGQVPIQSVVIGLDVAGQLPVVDPADFDLLLTGANDPPAPWVGVRDCGAWAQRLAGRVAAVPVAATILCRTLRMVVHLGFDDGLMVESLAYSTLLGGSEFRRWLSRRPTQPMPAQYRADPVWAAREGDILTLTLDHPDGRNAMTAFMRDALYTALANALADPSAPKVRLLATGRCFSTGGALAEFGTASDLAQAHIVRTLHANARLCHLLGDRLEVRFQGAAIGSGVEIPAAAGRRIATPDAWFQLPELGMGLIPGAGGTVSLSRAIGRHRTAWMVLSGARVGVTQAQQWGLVQRVVPE